LAFSFLPLCHAAYGEAAPPPALLENERLRVLGDEFQQLDVTTVDSSITAFQFFRICLRVASAMPV
jgi:hypothetical protein